MKALKGRTFQAQYVFLHYIMLEALLLGDVTIPVSSFADRYQRLQQPQRPTRKSLIDKQYEVGTVCKVSLQTCKVIIRTVNTCCNNTDGLWFVLFYCLENEEIYCWEYCWIVSASVNVIQSHVRYIANC